MAKKKQSNIPIDEKLRNLYQLQIIDSKMDELQKLKGELPMEVRDLEDDIVGLNTRLDKLTGETKEFEQTIAKYQNQIKDSEALIEKYERQQDNVKNNREFDALMRETELQKLDIQLANKRIREAKQLLSNKELTLDAAKKRKEEKESDVAVKREELKKIITKTEKEEKTLERKATRARKKIEDRLLKAYDRVRGAYRNGLSVVTIQRNACGGCYNEIPPQIQLELTQRKRIIVCEHCGRILVDDLILDVGKEVPAEENKA
ncbi:MAG: hypothetical protein GY810_09445 [Aureispira sp.]|nr:hypothetical protein [Aureispira sp.]